MEQERIEIERIGKEQKEIEQKEKKIIHVGIDGTICDSAKENDYENAKPIQNRIDAINKLYDAGHTIIMTTARSTNTGKDFSQLTKKQLKEWGVKYHDISFSKSNYDFLIDDKSISDKNLISFVDKLLPKKGLLEPFISRNYWLSLGHTLENKNHSLSNNELKFEKKPWANEIIFLSTDKFCAKIIRFFEGKKTQMHFHLHKHQTWFVYSGDFVYTFLNKKGEKTERILKSGEKVDVPPGTSHRIECIKDGDIIVTSYQSSKVDEMDDAFVLPDSFE